MVDVGKCKTITMSGAALVARGYTKTMNAIV